ncbi:hypothetical protein HMPREF9412_4003 [Paenibacillus sp. HGF5]|nr:hypothetical protein HMPREF9412_4003 [Paenibacillus sp. HGF5]
MALFPHTISRNPFNKLEFPNLKRRDYVCLVKVAEVTATEITSVLSWFCSFCL